MAAAGPPYNRAVTSARRSVAWIVTGMSGAGKATALRALEGAGVVCVDNLPVALVDGWAAANQAMAAAVVDARQGEALLGFVPPAGVRTLFLDAPDDVLLRRQGESLRPHPCAGAGGGTAAITAERALLVDVRAAADGVIDSGDLRPDDLARRVLDTVLPDRDPAAFQLTVSSFGFKHGPQTEADWVVDARILRNPFWEPELRPLTGADPRVRDYVLDQDASRALVDRLTDLLSWTAAQAVVHGRDRMHVAVGCTGGRHRSVVLATELGRRLAGEGVAVTVRHRDVERPDPR